MGGARSTVSVEASGPCDLNCLFCRRGGASGATASDGLLRRIDALGRNGHEELRILGCDPLRLDDLPGVVRQAADSGFQRVAVATNGVRLSVPGLARALVDMGVSEVILTLYSNDGRVHDAVTRRRGSHERLMRALRELEGLPLDVRVEIPILSTRAQDLPGMVKALSARLSRLVGIELYVPSSLPEGALDDLLVAPPLDELRPLLRAALDHADQAGVVCRLRPGSGVPFCGLPEDLRRPDVMPYHPGKPARRGDDAVLGAGCGECAMERVCTGVRPWYLERHSDRALTPLARGIADTGEGDRLREHFKDPIVRARAANVSLKVVRPTLVCNQRCPFCSAGETSENNFDGNDLRKKLTRWYGLGVRWLSFSGGEPTLVKELPSYVRIASRLGYENIEIVTNGTRTHVPDKARALAEAGLTNAFISLHAANEELSAKCTWKKGDWHKTTRSIRNFVDLGIHTRINHVISRINYEHLPEFVRWFHAEFGPTVSISFAFISPLFRASDAPAMVPRYSDVRPYLKEAMRYLQERDHEFVVLCRAGMPLCQLRGGFMVHSDLPSRVNEANSEDGYQKGYAPQCDDCVIRDMCPGMWTEYLDLHGYDDFVPLTADELEVPLDGTGGIEDRADEGLFQRGRGAVTRGRELPAPAVDVWNGVEASWREARATGEPDRVAAALGFATPWPEAAAGGGADAEEAGSRLVRGADDGTVSHLLRRRGLDHAEEAAYLAGLKPVLYLVVPPERRDAVRARYADHHVEELTSSDGVRLFVSREPSAARAAAEVYETGDPTAQAVEMGDLMGYPQCCVGAFVALPDRSNDSELVYNVARRMHAFHHPLLNQGLTHLVPFFPCRYDCSDAVEFARRTLEYLLPDGPEADDLRRAVLAELARPVLYFDKEHALLFEDAVARDFEVGFARARIVSRGPHARRDADLMWSLLAPAFGRARKLKIEADGWEIYGADGRLVLPRVAGGPGILLPFGPVPDTDEAPDAAVQVDAAV